MKNLFLIIIFFLLSFSISSKSLAANSSDVVINEVAWMGTTTSANDEWLELYNNTSNYINVDGWVLKSDDGTPEIKLTGAITANGFYLLERTDDNTVPDILADQIYTGALGNTGENLKLYDADNNLIDEAAFSSGWPAGDNKTKQTVERAGQNWQTSQNPGGTPKEENSSGAPAVLPVILPAATPTPPSVPNLIPTATPVPVTPALSETINYPDKIIFSEILPSPEGPDETEEWIEIQNQNSFEIDLSDWKIKDTIGRVVAYVFPIGSKIPSKGFLILKRPQTKISLNNTGDGLNLFSPDGKIRDSVSFEKAPLGQAYNKTAAGWEWSTTLTPNSANIILGKEEIKKGATPSSTPNEETTIVELSPKKQTAAASAAAAKLPKNLLPILISIPLALFSALLIFFLKKYLAKQS